MVKKQTPNRHLPVVGLLLVVLLWSPSAVWAQEITQQIRGTVTDKLSTQGISGAQVSLLKKSEVVFSAISSDQGEFLFDKVPVGRYRLEVLHTSYHSFSTEVFAQSSRELWVDVALIERVRQLDEIEVTPDGKALYSIPGERELSIEKATRIAANYFDPVRVTTAFPGVVIANDQNNAIIVRGNSPDGLLWRLNGLDILNPNHLSNAGTLSDQPAANGGGVNMLSTQMLGATRFINDSYEPSYGNFQSAVVDMTLRESRTGKISHTAQASLIGLDYASEGSIVPGKLSYTANLRYSTVGLLSAMGVDFGGESIAFKDISAQLVYTNNKKGVLKFFFVAGDSKSDFKAKPVAEWEEDKDRFNIQYTGNSIISGVSFTTPLKNDAGFKAGIAWSVSNQDHFKDFAADPQAPERWSEFDIKNRLLSQYLAYHRRLGTSTWLEIGNYVNAYATDLYSYEIPKVLDCLFCAVPSDGIDGTFETWQVATYATLRQRFSEKWNATIGVRGVKTGMYSAYGLEPRAALQFDISESQYISLNYSKISRLQSASIYLSEQNENLEATKIQQLSLNYSRSIGRELLLRSSAYYQYLYDVPVQTGSTFSVYNLMEYQERGGLVNDGAARNYGFDLTVEKSFFDDFYFMAGGSVYTSEYRDGANYWLNSRFDGRYTFNFSGGKEWSKTRSKSRNTFGVDTRFLYLGGLYEMPILFYASEFNGSTVFNEPEGYSSKIPDYTRLDLRLSWRKHKPGYTRSIIIDIQNVLNLQNIAYHYYDAFKDERAAQYSLGIIPILAYRVEF